ncbi:MAG: hypothetical protein WCS77_08835 [Elusimicrobiaceae bacterium]
MKKVLLITVALCLGAVVARNGVFAQERAEDTLVRTKVSVAQAEALYQTIGKALEFMETRKMPSAMIRQEHDALFIRMRIAQRDSARSIRIARKDNRNIVVASGIDPKMVPLNLSKLSSYTSEQQKKALGHELMQISAMIINGGVDEARLMSRAILIAAKLTDLNAASSEQK